MDPNTAMETIGAGAKAATKLGEIIEKVFGPRWTRKQADADAYACIREMFFVLLRADRYAGILEADGGFELFPINGAPQLQRFPRLLFAGCRYARRRSSANKGKLQQACNDRGCARNDHIGGFWRHQAKNQRQKTQSQQKQAINAVAHRPLFAPWAFRGVRSDAVYRIPDRGAAPPALSFQTLVQQFRGFSVHSRIIVVAYLKKIHGASPFRNHLIESAENSIHSISDCHRAVRYAVMC